MNKIKLQKKEILSIFFFFDWVGGTFIFFSKTWHVLCFLGMHTSLFNEDCLLLLYETLTILSSLLVTSINAHLKLACNLVLPFLLCATGWSWAESLLPAEGLMNRRIDLGFGGDGVCLSSLPPLCL